MNGRSGFTDCKMSDDEVQEEKELDLSSPDVVTKYKSAAEIVNSNVLSSC